MEGFSVRVEEKDDLKPVPLPDVQIKEEHSIKQEKKQLPQFTAVCVKSEEPSLPDVRIHWSPELSLKQEIPETPQIKEEPEKQSVKQEEETPPKTDNVAITDVSSLREVSEKHNHSTNTSPLLQQRAAQKKTEDRDKRSEADKETNNSSYTDGDEAWEPPASTLTAQMETEADGDHDNQVQIKDTSTAAHGPTTGTAAGQLECIICKKRFAARCSLAAHVKIHEGAKPYSCSTCHRAFEHSAGLKKHERMHTDEKRYTCLHCEELFVQKRLLDAHMRTHTRVRPHKCSECEKTFNQKRYLDVHLKIHSGERPFSCSICKKAFGRKGNLQKHELLHTREKKSP